MNKETFFNKYACNKKILDEDETYFSTDEIYFPINKIDDSLYTWQEAKEDILKFLMDSNGSYKLTYINNCYNGEPMWLVDQAWVAPVG